MGKYEAPCDQKNFIIYRPALCKRRFFYLYPLTAYQSKALTHRPGSPRSSHHCVDLSAKRSGPPVHEDTGVHASRWVNTLWPRGSNNPTSNPLLRLVFVFLSDYTYCLQYKPQHLRHPS